MARAASPFGIIAAAGPMPLTVAQELRASGHEVVIISLKSITDADFSGFQVYDHRFGCCISYYRKFKIKRG